MKKLLSILFILISISSLSQQNGNEWINFSQQYFKIPIYKTGIHRLDYLTIKTTLFNLGINVSTIPTSEFQVFGREKEIPLFIEDGNDGFLNTDDYIEFYAEKNDSWLDSLVYESGDYVPDPYYSLFNDTIRYYLTWNNQTNGLRMQQETAINFNSFNPIDFCWGKSYIKYNSSYSLGEQLEGLSSPLFEEGEGWVGNVHTKGNSYDEVLTTNNPYPSPNSAKARVTIVSSNSVVPVPPVNPPLPNHNTKLFYNNNLIIDSSYFGYKKINFEFPLSTVSNNSTITHEIASIGQGSDRQHVSEITLWYPHTFDFNGDSTFTFGIPFNTQSSKSRLDFSNLNQAVSNPILYVLNDQLKRVKVIYNNLNGQVLVPNSSNGDSSICFIVDSTNFISINQLSPINGSGYFRDLNSLNLNEAYVIISHEKLMPAAIDYGSYRSNQYDTVVINIEELYHQFGGGIYLHPLSIKRFIKMTMDEWNTWPSHLFLIGKSISIAKQGAFTPRTQPSTYQNCLVPSWGYPSSDNHFTVGLLNNSEGFAIPTGRRSTTSLSSAYVYLNKVQDYELQQTNSSLYSIPNKEWQKQIIHFGGGTDSTEQNYITNWLGNFENTIEDSLFGGFVHNYSKDPFSSTLNNNDFQEVNDLLENGVSLITFFGHSSSGSGFSQNIDSPDNWNNPSKYPMVIGIGCYSGDVHGIDTTNYAESLVGPADEGAIGFVSTIKQGFTPYTNQYVSFLYERIANDGYGKTIGQQMKMNIDYIDDFTAGIAWNPIYQSNYNGMSLQGDPALKINSHSLPEIILDETRVWHEPSNIDLSIDTFSLYVVVTNVGKAFSDSLYLSVSREYPGGQDSIYDKTVYGTYYRDTVEFRIPTNASIGIGVNNFTIKADLPITFIEEQQDEYINNEISKTIIISSNALFPIWPYDYSIIGNQIETLKGSTMNPFESEKKYFFEIDTTDEFNSPFKKQQEIISVGGVIEAKPNDWINSNTLSPSPLFFTDSTVYFWRCATDSSVLNWEESSFQYISNKWGWGQSHFFQYKNNSYSGINYNRPNRTFDFSPSLVKLEVDNFVGWQSGTQINSTFWKLNGQVKDYGGYLYPSIMVAVVDPISLKHWCTDCPNGITIGGPCDSYHCVGQWNGCPAICGTSNFGRNRRHGFFMFNMNYPDQMDTLAHFLNNYIPDSSYIIAYTFIYDKYTLFTTGSTGGQQPLGANVREYWPPQLYAAFQNLGATNLSPNSPNDGFIFFSKKGAPSSSIEIHTSDTLDPSTSPYQFIDLETYLEGSETSGAMIAKVAGPAYNWNSIYWEHSPLENPSMDSLRIKIYGISANSGQNLFIDTVMHEMDSINNLNSIINASLYPKIKLEVFNSDKVNSTPGQFERLQIIYDPVPELAINPKKGYYLNVENDGIQEGDSVEVAVAIENVSAFDMDSLLVNYTIYDENFSPNIIYYPRQDSLKSGELLLDTIKFSSLNYENENNLWIAANPKDLNGNQDQLEQLYFNNILQTKFNTLTDEINPILDVTFDGFHILNNDIISPTPYIVISLDDENEFLLLNEETDTSNFSINLLLPNTNTWERVYFINSNGEENLKFFPATDTKNKCRIEYNPSFVLDGKYSLKVQARDKKNNNSGDSEYQIDFEVITTSSLSNIYNYPNPFSTKTHFVFTLTGNIFPDELLIQIFTVSGKIIKEINLNDMGSIKIGHNKTDYFWDGRDKFGDLLANGIYFYKVTAKINGEDIEHRPTSGDHSFKKGFGKMYLLR